MLRRAVFCVLFLSLLHAAVTLNAGSVDLADADIAFNTFLRQFWSNQLNYLADQLYPYNWTATAYWTYAQGWDCVLDNIALHKQLTGTVTQQQKALISQFYEGQASRGWYSGYYDDETWMTLALLYSYSLTANTTYLQTATTLFKDVMSAWDISCCGSAPGGIWWDKAHTQKATASNAGPVIAALQLYGYLKDASYATFAVRVYTYWLDNMVNKANYQVCDHINPNGEKVWWVFSYNEGLMLGASAEMYRLTKNTTYLNIAQKIVNFIRTAETILDNIYGTVLFDGSGCSGDCNEFKGITFRYLTEFYKLQTELNLTGDRDSLAFLQSNVNALWNLARNSNNLFATNWLGPPLAIGQSCYQSQQNSAVMALNLFVAAVNKI